MAPHYRLAVMCECNRWWVNECKFEIRNAKIFKSQNERFPGSQVSDTLNSLSFPSEPPDIRNWFPSYVYESPELNTLDGFKDFDGCVETSREEEVKVKSDATANVGKFVDGLFVGEKGFSDGIGKRTESDEFGHGKPAVVVSDTLYSLPSEPPDIRNWFPSYAYESLESDTLDGFKDFDGCAETSLEKAVNEKSDATSNVGKLMVSGLSESLSQCSEPPDVRNWFFSYVYESPSLDTMDKFTSAYKEKEDQRVSNSTLKLCRGNGKDATAVGDITMSPSQNRIPTAILKCSTLVENAKQDKESVCKDDSNIDLEPRSSVRSQCTSEKNSEQILPGELTQNQNQNHASVEISGNKKTDDNDYDAKFGCSIRENDAYSLKGKSLCKSIGMKDFVEDSLEEDYLHKPETLYSIVESSLRRPIAGSIENENKETELPENGFISTRKNISRESNNGNQRMHLGVQQLESKKNGTKCCSNSEKDVKTKRKALSETTNFHSSSTALEITGKWRCPQKHKPNLGPPLKQLRVEQWVRRV